MIYLYVKTHNITGLKYLGKTIKDPLIYKGSGLYWTRHIKEHGNNVTTKIIFQTENKELFKKVGIFYSEIYNIVESNEWANITIEEGQGGGVWKGRNRPSFSAEWKAKMSESALGKKTPKTLEAKLNISKNHASKKEGYINVLKGRNRPPFSAEWKVKMSNTRTGQKRGPYKKKVI